MSDSILKYGGYSGLGNTSTGGVDWSNLLNSSGNSQMSLIGSNNNSDFMSNLWKTSGGLDNDLLTSGDIDPDWNDVDFGIDAQMNYGSEGGFQDWMKNFKLEDIGLGNLDMGDIKDLAQTGLAIASYGPTMDIYKKKSGILGQQLKDLKQASADTKKFNKNFATASNNLTT